MKVALVHDWLTGMRGGEKCLEVLSEIYPEADLYTLFIFEDKVSESIKRLNIKTSFLQRIPDLKRFYRYFLPLFPVAIESFDLKDYELVISISHCVAKGIIPMPDTLHLSYCLTPMRYIWDMERDYFGEKKGLKRLLLSPFLNYLRLWDVSSSQRVDKFFAISKHIQQRIKKYYRRDSTLIYPPVDCDFFTPPPDSFQDDFFLMVTALTPYKRVDLAIEAFNRLGRRLIIIGDGQLYTSLKKRAKKNIELLGWLKAEDVREYYRRCRALIFPGEEDFGIVPLEAQACGRPVIAYGRGGVLESVIPYPQKGATGIFFTSLTLESIIEAVSFFEGVANHFNQEEIRKNALRFDKKRFRDKISTSIWKRYESFKKMNKENPLA